MYLIDLNDTSTLHLDFPQGSNYSFQSNERFERFIALPGLLHGRSMWSVKEVPTLLDGGLMHLA